jgi:hypothetical protein
MRCGGMSPSKRWPGLSRQALGNRTRARRHGLIDFLWLGIVLDVIVVALLFSVFPARTILLRVRLRRGRFDY